jgi:hypothetical protein
MAVRFGRIFVLMTAGHILLGKAFVLQNSPCGMIHRYGRPTAANSRRCAKAIVMDTSLDSEALQERANAHAVGLLQNPFSADGYSGAFLGLPHHHKTSGPSKPPPPMIGPVPQLDPFTDGGRWPEGCPLDPFALVKEDLAPLSDSIRELVATDHPVLSKAAEHFFAERHGKRFRPTIVMLIGKATAQDPENHNSGDAYEKQVAHHHCKVQLPNAVTHSASPT